jgi:hypothetical protein
MQFDICFGEDVIILTRLSYCECGLCPCTGIYLPELIRYGVIDKCHDKIRYALAVCIKLALVSRPVTFAKIWTC